MAEPIADHEPTLADQVTELVRLGKVEKEALDELNSIVKQIDSSEWCDCFWLYLRWDERWNISKLLEEK